VIAHQLIAQNPNGYGHRLPPLSPRYSKLERAACLVLEASSCFEAGGIASILDGNTKSDDVGYGGEAAR
jgi:hypothetical protein